MSEIGFMVISYLFVKLTYDPIIWSNHIFDDPIILFCPNYLTYLHIHII